MIIGWISFILPYEAIERAGSGNLHDILAETSSDLDVVTAGLCFRKRGIAVRWTPART